VRSRRFSGRTRAAERAVHHDRQKGEVILQFSEVFKDADELLAVEVEELARLVLEYLKANADAKGVTLVPKQDSRR
jgi:hypothetical protein